MKRILLCLMAFSAIISSCTRDHGDMYDPEFVREYYESQWKKQFGEIDPNQSLLTLILPEHAFVDLHLIAEYLIMIVHAIATVLADTVQTTYPDRLYIYLRNISN